MSTKGAKSGSKKPKVLPIGLGVSPDGMSFSQTMQSPGSRGASSVRSPVFSDIDDDDDDRSRGRSSSARRSKAAVKRLTDNGPTPTSPLSPNINSTRSSSSMGQSHNGTRADPKALDVEDCLAKMVKFVKAHGLKAILGRDLSDEELREKLRPQAEVAAKLPTKLKYVSRELAMNLAILTLYDLAVLIDDSISMEFEESGKRIKALKTVLTLIAEIYEAVSDPNDARGIHAIRFLNGNVNDNGKKQDITTLTDINKIIDEHEFEGLTRIGTGLMRNILKPLVFKETKKNGRTVRTLNKDLKRPLLIMVVTDGAVEGEDPARLEKAILSVVKCLRKELDKNFDPRAIKAIAFQFARVGNDSDAQQFLEDLDNNSSVRDYVDTLSGADLMDVTGVRDNQDLTPKLQRRIIKLLLGPIQSEYDKIKSDEKNNDDSSGDDFSESEEEEEEEDIKANHGGESGDPDDQSDSEVE